MADITLCANNECPNRSRCYRANAEPSKHWQSVAVFNPLNKQPCEHYWPMEGKK